MGRLFIFLLALVFCFNGNLLAQQAVAIHSATIVNSTDVENPIENGVIIIKEGRISAVGTKGEMEIPDDAKLIDASGKWVIPGLIEVHTHSDTLYRFKQALALGITTAHTMPGISDTTLTIEPRASKPSYPAPRIIQNSWMFSGSFPDNIAPGYWKVVKPATVSEATEKLKRVRQYGFQEIKVFMDTGRLWFGTGETAPNLSEDIMKALIQGAHQLRMRVYAHTWEVDNYRKLVRYGVDNIIHPAADGLLNSTVWESMKNRDMTWTATVSGLERLGAPAEYARRILDDPNLKAVMTTEAVKQAASDTASDPTPYIDIIPLVYSKTDEYRSTVNKNTRLALKNGVAVAVGSDNPVGVGTHVEMEMLQEAGLSPSQVLKAATRGGAKTLALEEQTGSIEAGKRADLVILNSNPLKDIRNTRDVEMIIKQGEIFNRDRLIHSLSK